MSASEIEGASLAAETGGDDRWSRRFGLTTGLLLVVANMIGTGVFTTTGFLVRDVPSVPAVLIAWGIGGVVALCGALTYAELARAYPNNGGEYHLLTKIYGPSLGFLSGCSAFIAGFSAPIAVSSMAFAKYLGGAVGGMPALPVATGLVIVLALLQLKSAMIGARFQNAFTFGKLALIVGFIVAGCLFADWSYLAPTPKLSVGTAIVSPELAVGLVYISFTYSGWNAAAYVAGELRNPNRTVPLALVGGTLIVMLLYVGLNVVFLASAPMERLAGQVDIGHVAAENLFGRAAGRGMSLIIAAGLVSTVGAMMIAGPRVYEAIGWDYPKLAVLRKRSADGSPVVAILIQAVVAIGLIASMKFEELLRFIGVTLSIFSILTVIGVFVVRRRLVGRTAGGFAVWKSIPPLLFIALESWMIWHTVRSDPMVLVVTAAVLAAALGLYFVVRGDSNLVSGIRDQTDSTDE